VSDTYSIDCLGIVGVGLIGGSVARAARAAGLCRAIIGWDASEAASLRAVELGVIDRAAADLAALARDCDVIVLATPLGVMEDLMRQLVGAIRPDAILTDVGSAKRSVIEAARRVFGDLPVGFVPAHPIAGTERSGVEASFASLFQRRCVILTPLPTTAPWAIAKTRALWEGMGAEVVEMDAAHHDEVLAATSHLPHVLAYALVDTLAQMNEHSEIFRYAAGGFRDFTRIASSDPIMWRDICLANGEAVLSVLGRYQQELAAVAEAVQRGDGAAIEQLFRRAKNARDSHVIA